MSDPLNLYYLHLNPTLAAESTADQHIRETVEVLPMVLANVYLGKGAKTPAPLGYQQAFQPEHDIARWVAEDFKQWDWAYMYAYRVMQEAQERFKFKNAAVLEAMNYMGKARPIAWMPNREFYEPPMLIPAQYRSRVSGTKNCYRRWYKEGLRDKLAWTGRLPPLWLYEEKIVEYQAKADELVNSCDLALIEPDKQRPKGLSDIEWEIIKYIATENINGRDADPETAPVKKKK